MKSIIILITLCFTLSLSSLAQTTSLAQNSELLQAVKSNNIELATQLINEGADINWKNNKGQNFLFFTNDRKMLELLINMGINIDDKDHRSKTALVDAIEKKDQQKAFILLEYNASITPVNDNIDELKTDKFFMQYLQSSGANFPIRDKEYRYLEEAGTFDLAGILGLGLMVPRLYFDNKSIPFLAGGTIGYVPYYKYKVNGTALIEFIGSSQIYYTNLKFIPTLKYSISPSGTYIGAGIEYNYILAASYSTELEIEGKPNLSGYRSSFAPYISFGNEFDEGIMELGYRVRTQNRPGQLYFLFGFKSY